MKSFLNYSKLAIATLITSSVFVACSDEITETTCDTPYVVNSGNIRSAGDAVDLGLPSGTKWASKNIGAASESDNGVLFVWGDATGNQLLASTATSYTDVTDFISSSVLFDRYKAAEGSVGFVYDTINVHKESISLSEFTLEQAENNYDLETAARFRHGEIPRLEKELAELNSMSEKRILSDTVNEEDIATLSESKYFYAVRNKKSTANLETKEQKAIKSEYFWITTKNNEAVIFYQQ
jgi:hypothetical protein